MRNSFIEDVLREWKADAGITHLMLYRVKNGVLIVYTDKPGPLIGCRGERIARFTDKLMKVPYPKVTAVKLEETDGIF